MIEERDADVAWVERLSGSDPSRSEDALREAARQRRLFSHLARQHRSEGRDSYVEIAAPLELHAMVRLLRPEHVVEVGVSSGVSSAYLLNALARNGTGLLHSVDLPRRPARRTRPDHAPRASWTLPAGRDSGWAVPHALRVRWDLRLGDKSYVLPMLAEQLPSIDLLVYDVPHEDTATRREFRLLSPKLRPGGVVIVDHGSGGGLCPALAGWAEESAAEPIGRRGSGLFGFRRPPEALSQVSRRKRDGVRAKGRAP